MLPKFDKWPVLSVFLIFSLFIGYHYELFSNISTALIDWFDYPLIVFILEQNISQLISFDLANLFNISSYYPSPGGGFFTDILLVQSIFGIFIYPFTQNFILITNIIFFLTGLINIISLHFFWSKIFTKKIVINIATFLFVFSPYYFSQYVHYQMVAYAFFFFSAGMIIDKPNTKKYLLAGALSGFQFLAGVYLGIFSLTMAGFILIWQNYENRNIKLFLKHSLFYMFGFLVIAGFFVFKYAQVKYEYQIVRDAGEYVDQALQPTDIFFNHHQSLWVNYIYKNINQFDGHIRGEKFSIGLVLATLTVVGIITARKKRHMPKLSILMLALLLWGVFAGLGPRLTVNGNYLGWPLPYIFFLKFSPIFDAIRGTGRWFFFIQIALVFFSSLVFTQIIDRFKNGKSIALIALIMCIYLVEMLPIKQRTSVESYLEPPYEILTSNCRSKDVLLEYPFSPTLPKTTIFETLTYWSKMLLNLTHYKCKLVNGYNGYDPSHYLNFRDNLEQTIQNNDLQGALEVLKSKTVTYIKINKNKIKDEDLFKVDFFKSAYFVPLYESKDFLLLNTNYD